MEIIKKQGLNAGEKGIYRYCPLNELQTSCAFGMEMKLCVSGFIKLIVTCKQSCRSVSFDLA